MNRISYCICQKRKREGGVFVLSINVSHKTIIQKRGGKKEGGILHEIIEKVLTRLWKSMDNYM